jgi:hypothetical protein
MAAAVTPPLTLGEILDRTIQLYRRNFLLFVAISLGPAAFYVLVSGSVSLYFTSHAAQLGGPPNFQILLAFFGVLAAFLVLGLPLLAAVSSVSLSSLNFAASLRNSHHPATPGSAYAHAFRRFWRYLGILTLQILFSLIIPGAVFSGIFVLGTVSAGLLAASGASQALAVLAGLLIFLLVIALFVVMIYIWLRLSLAIPASFTEDLKPWPAIQRSNRLTKGTRGRIFVMYLLVAILFGVLYYALTVPVDIILGLTFFKSTQMVALLSKPPVLLQVVNLFISFLQRAFVMPVYAIALVLFYNDQRTRMEGYDIELLMAQAGLVVPPPAPETDAAPLVSQPEPAPFLETLPAPSNPETPSHETSSPEGLPSPDSTRDSGLDARRVSEPGPPPVAEPDPAHPEPPAEAAEA